MKRKDKNCYNCKYYEVYYEAPQYRFVSLCEKDCMNHYAICPFWESEEE